MATITPPGSPTNTPTGSPTNNLWVFITPPGEVGNAQTVFPIQTDANALDITPFMLNFQAEAPAVPATTSTPTNPNMEISNSSNQRSTPPTIHTSGGDEIGVEFSAGEASLRRIDKFARNRLDFNENADDREVNSKRRRTN